MLYMEQFEAAKKMMAAAETFYRARTAEKARMWILTTAVVTTAVLTLVAGVSGWIGGVVVTQPDNLFEQMALGGLAGAWGSLASLVQRASVLGVDATAGPRLHHLEAFCRIIIGTAAGALGICGIAAGILAPALLKAGSAMMILVGFAGGFGTERFLPTLVGKVQPSAANSIEPPAVKK